MSKKTTDRKRRSRRKFSQPQGKVGGIDHDERTVQLSLPIAEVLAGVGDALERVTGEAALLIMKALIDEEVEGLAGRRYEHQEDRQAHRWGQQRSHVVFAGKKVAFKRPRVRSEGKEIALERLRLFQNSGRMQEAAARQVTLGVSTRDYEKAVDGVCDGYGIRKSSISRHWKVVSTKKLGEFMERRLDQVDLAAILIDGIHFNDQVLTVSIGVCSDGSKHVLGLWQGATENTQVCKDLLTDMIRRGLNAEERYLFVLDGSKALHKAVKSLFGDNAVIQRCQVHKRRNVLSYLPKRQHFSFSNRLRMAWDMANYADAKEELEKIIAELRAVNESAARSLHEGLEETLTVHRLGLPWSLRRSLRSTNLIENCFASTRKFCRNVKRWRNTNMVLRWGGTMLREAEKRFHRLKGHRSMPVLLAALRKTAIETKAKRA